MTEDDSERLTRDIAPFGVRMPPDLKARVKAAADANNRSMNAEIVNALEQLYPAETIVVGSIRPMTFSQEELREIVASVVEAAFEARDKKE